MYKKETLNYLSANFVSVIEFNNCGGDLNERIENIGSQLREHINNLAGSHIMRVYSTSYKEPEFRGVKTYVVDGNLNYFYFVGKIIVTSVTFLRKGTSIFLLRIFIQKNFRSIVEYNWDDFRASEFQT